MWPEIVLTLDQRQLLTRMLCWAYIVGFCVAMPLWAAFFGAALIEGLRPFAGQILYFLLASVVLTIASNAALPVWRRCDRCAFRLYPWMSPFTPLGLIRGPSGVERHPDHRAERFLGSLQRGGLVSMATTGVAHCIWCGHADGADDPDGS